ncbi:MAG: aspartate-semialdehyde dehydrogenase [Bacteriovoracia bacterium]
MNVVKKKPRVAVIGATGAVGRELVSILEQRSFVCESLSLFASSKNKGKKIPFRGSELEIKELPNAPDQLAWSDFDLAFFTAGSRISEGFVPAAVNAGVFSIDNASLFRLNEGVPLIVPEVNADKVSGSLVANPNCTTAQLVVALKPIHDLFELEEVIVTSFQAVSGAGQKGIDEFLSQVGSEKKQSKVFPHPIVYDCIPQIDSFREDGFTGEEYKVIAESKKILGLPTLKVTATCVRVPVLNGHSESVWVKTKKNIDLKLLRNRFDEFSGIKYLDDPTQNKYPLAQMASGTDPVYIGRLRMDPNRSDALLMWVVSDNLRKGAALNAVQIAETALEKRLVFRS